MAVKELTWYAKSQKIDYEEAMSKMKDFDKLIKANCEKMGYSNLLIVQPKIVIKRMKKNSK